MLPPKVSMIELGYGTPSNGKGRVEDRRVGLTNLIGGCKAVNMSDVN